MRAYCAVSTDFRCSPWVGSPGADVAAGRLTTPLDSGRVPCLTSRDRERRSICGLGPRVIMWGGHTRRDGDLRGPGYRLEGTPERPPLVPCLAGIRLAAPLAPSNGPTRDTHMRPAHGQT